MKTKKINYVLLLSFLLLLIPGCDNSDDFPINESLQEGMLKSANSKVDKIPIQILTGNGKYITIEVPPNAVEQILNNSEKTPYSPIGVYVFHNIVRDEYYDVFVTNFDGTNYNGTFGFPAGGPYDYIGPVSVYISGPKLGGSLYWQDYWGPIKIGTFNGVVDEFDGIIELDDPYSLIE